MTIYFKKEFADALNVEKSDMLDATCGQFTLKRNCTQYRMHFIKIIIRQKSSGFLLLLCFITCGNNTHLEGSCGQKRL